MICRLTSHASKVSHLRKEETKKGKGREKEHDMREEEAVRTRDTFDCRADTKCTEGPTTTYILTD